MGPEVAAMARGGREEGQGVLLMIDGELVRCKRSRRLAKRWIDARHVARSVVERLVDSSKACVLLAVRIESKDTVMGLSPNPLTRAGCRSQTHTRTYDA